MDWTTERIKIIINSIINSIIHVSQFYLTVIYWLFMWNNIATFFKQENNPYFWLDIQLDTLCIFYGYIHGKSDVSFRFRCMPFYLLNNFTNYADYLNLSILVLLSFLMPYCILQHIQNYISVRYDVLLLFYTPKFQ